MNLRKAAGVGGLTMLLAGLGLAGAVPASAAASCANGPGVGEVTVKLAGADTSTLSRVGNQVRLNGANCGAAGATKVTVVETAAGIQDFAVQLPFGVKVGVNLGANPLSKDLVRVAGTAAANTIRAGTAGIDLTGDGIADLTTNPLQAIVIDGGAGDDTLNGGGGGWMGGAFGRPLDLRGGPGADLLVGGTMRDSLHGSLGNDVLNGNGGRDIATYLAAPSGVQVNLAPAVGTATGGDGTDQLIGIEDVVGSKFADKLQGSSGPNTLVGAAGVDSLNGLDGDDVLNGGTGNDVLAGSNGLDTASYVDAAGPVDVDLATQTSMGADGNDTMSNVDNTSGSKHPDTLVGNGNPNVLMGYDGADVLVGVGGKDVLYGLNGDDSLAGGAGADVLLGGAGSDFLSGGLDTDTCDPGVGPNPPTVGCP